MTTSNPVLIVEPDSPVTRLTLNRPDKRNALNVDVLQQLDAAIAAADSEPAQRVLVLRGAGPVFCSGMDLAEAARPEQSHRSAEMIEQVFRRLATTRLITIALVQGAALAGGAGLMCACDFVIATRDARLGFPEVRRGLVPALVLALLRRQLRERDARELVLLGGVCEADYAQRIGLISRIVADEPALATAAEAIVASVLQGGPAAVSATKQLLGQLWPRPLEDDFKAAHAVHLTTRMSAEAQEGFAAFLEKRPPAWEK